MYIELFFCLLKSQSAIMLIILEKNFEEAQGCSFDNRELN